MNVELMREYMGWLCLSNYYAEIEDEVNEDECLGKLDTLWRTSNNDEFREVEEAMRLVYRNHHDTYETWKEYGHTPQTP